MATSSDEIFVSVAVEKGFLTQAQVEQCRQALEQRAALGLKTSFHKMAQTLGLLTDDQVQAIRQGTSEEEPHPTLGGYEVIAKLGQGGMGAVYKARQVVLDRLVALKVLPKSLAQQPEFAKRFEQEARLAAQLSHPNLIPVHDVGVSGPYHYIAMEFVAGRDVAQMTQEGPIAERRALEIVLGVARGLELAHSRHIIHRDIKPDNIIVAENGTPRLADLGIARDIEADGPRLTQMGQVVGTPAYMAPEQARGDRDVDGRADIYSLGATLFHMVTGRQPFSGPTTVAIMRAQLTEPLPDPRALNPGLSESVVALIRRMMEKRREDRHQTCGDLIRDIEDILSGGAPAAVRRQRPAPAAFPMPRPAAASRRAPFALAAVAVIVLAIGAGVGVVVLLRHLQVAGRQTAVAPRPTPTPGRAPSAPEPTPVPAPAPVPDAPATTIERLHAAIRGANPAYTGKGRFVFEGDRIVEAALDGCGIQDISPLKGLGLKRLSFADNQVRGLAPLAGMPLEALDCRANPVDSLEPLLSLPLRSLDCGGTAVSDLTPLKKLPLRELGISGLDLPDPSLLGDMPVEKLAFSPGLIKGDLGRLRTHTVLKSVGLDVPLSQANTPVAMFWTHWESLHKPATPTPAPPPPARPETDPRDAVRVALQKKERFTAIRKPLRDLLEEMAKCAEVRLLYSPDTDDIVDRKVTEFLSLNTIEVGLATVLNKQGLDFDVTKEGVKVVKCAADEIKKRAEERAARLLDRR